MADLSSKNVPYQGDEADDHSELQKRNRRFNGRGYRKDDSSFDVRGLWSLNADRFSFEGQREVRPRDATARDPRRVQPETGL